MIPPEFLKPPHKGAHHRPHIQIVRIIIIIMTAEN